MTTNQPPYTDATDAFAEGLDANGYALLTATAQQAVLPRRLDEGVYAILDADGAIQVVETKGYAQQRKHDWQQAHSDKPEFVHRQVTLLDVDSFIAYLAANSYELETEDEIEYTVGSCYDHGVGNLELWADIDARTIKAILDGYDGLRKHTATLQLKTSREWGEWLAIDGKLLDQVDFAQFIQDHISTIGRPDGGLLVDICETLTGTVGVNWKSQNLDRNGQRKFVYEEVVDGKAGAKGDLDVPTELTLVLRPFQGSAQIGIVARFRYRLAGGSLLMGVKLAEPEKALEDAFTAVVAEVQQQVPVHVNNGRG